LGGKGQKNKPESNENNYLQLISGNEAKVFGVDE